jgi:hypothetical protein
MVLGREPTAMMRPAPRSAVPATPVSPTGPAPVMATTSPNWISIRSAPVKPVAAVSSALTA